MKTLPIIDWTAVENFLQEIDRASGRIVLAVYPPDASKPCIHIPAEAAAIPHAQVEQQLQRHPGHSLGAVLNYPAPQPPDWGTQPEHYNRAGIRRAWGASNGHIAAAIGGWGECDGGLLLEAQDALPAVAGLLPPSLSVWTGGKSLHHYWLPQPGELLTPEQFRQLQRVIAAAFLAAAPDAKPDRALGNPARVMRLPGGLHPATGDRCRIHHVGPRYPLPELMAMIPPPPAPAPLASSPPAVGGSTVRELQTIGQDWFERLPLAEQQEVAVELMHHVPRRGAPGSGTYPDALRALAGLVHHFGHSTAEAICSRAGWQSEHWDQQAKLSSIDAHHDPAGIGTVIRLARDGGWRPSAPEHRRSRRPSRPQRPYRSVGGRRA